jgi:hypothetical protein
MVENIKKKLNPKLQQIIAKIGIKNKTPHDKWHRTLRKLEE